MTAENDGRVLVRPAPYNAETPVPALAAELTPDGLHYVRTNFPIPSLDPARHRVTLDGDVARPLEIPVAELAAGPMRDVAVTLECAGNHRLTLAPIPEGEPWAGGAVASAVWSGVPLHDLLERAGLAPDALEVVVEGADGGPIGGRRERIPFARSLPLERALHPDTLLALRMNGRPLPREHGAPIRLVVPGWYGMASVKWVARITVLRSPFEGYFQRERYVYDPGDGAPTHPVDAIRVKSILTSPAGGAELPRGPLLVTGWAWSGTAPVTRVEVAIDGGGEWREARLLPSASPHLWRRWELDWDAPAPGRHSLRVRAHDGSGATQPDVPEWNRLGYGANGVHSITVTVR